MDLDGLKRIGRTSGDVTTAWNSNWCSRPIKVNQPRENPLHERVPANTGWSRAAWLRHLVAAATNSLCGAVRTDRLQRTSTAPRAGAPAVTALRNAARSRRRARLRSTALPNDRPIVKARPSESGWPVTELSTWLTHSRGVRYLGALARAEKTAGRETGAITHLAWCDPDDDAS